MARLDLISCEQDNDTLVTKSTYEDFFAKSVLVVNESQEALFYKDGQALDLFPSGRYELNTYNIPLLTKVFGKFFNQSKTPFPCSVVFINKVCVLSVGWGTDNPITVDDPVYNRLIALRANGQMAIKVSDSRKFVVKVVGQLKEFDVATVRKSIKAMVMAYVRSSISGGIRDLGCSVLEINNELPSLSDSILAQLNPRLEPLGLELENFYVAEIIPDEEDLATLRAVKDEASATVIMSEAQKKASMRATEAKAYDQQQLGYTFQEKRQYDVLETAAGNQATGGAIMNAGVGIGMGVGMMGAVGGMMNNAMHPQQQGGQQQMPQQMPQQPQMQQPGTPCPACGQMVPGGMKFCPNCGNKMEAAPAVCAQCGAQLPPGTKFCPNCGAPAVAKQEKFCPQCGAKIEGDLAFCPNCGNKLK